MRTWKRLRQCILVMLQMRMNGRSPSKRLALRVKGRPRVINICRRRHDAGSWPRHAMLSAAPGPTPAKFADAFSLRAATGDLKAVRPYTNARLH